MPPKSSANYLLVIEIVLVNVVPLNYSQQSYSLNVMLVNFTTGLLFYINIIVQLM